MIQSHTVVSYNADGCNVNISSRTIELTDKNRNEVILRDCNAENLQDAVQYYIRSRKYLGSDDAADKERMVSFLRNVIIDCRDAIRYIDPTAAEVNHASV